MNNCTTQWLLRQMNACLGIYEIQAKKKDGLRIRSFETLRSVVKKHGAEKGMVIQLLCFDRLLVLHLAARCADDLWGVTADVLVMGDFCCRVKPKRELIVTICVSFTCHWK